MNCYFLVRILTRMKPVNFVLYEILHAAGTRMALVVGCVLLTVFSVPAMMVFFACMLEQKISGRSQRKPGDLKGKWPRAVLLLVVLNLFLILGLVLLYGAVMVIAAILVTLFAKAYTATAVMATVSYRIEWMILFLGSVMAVVTDFGAMTVLYHQFGFTVPVPAKEYDFPKQEGYSRKRWFLTLTAVFSGIAAFMVLIWCIMEIRRIRRSCPRWRSQPTGEAPNTHRKIPWQPLKKQSVKWQITARSMCSCLKTACRWSVMI